MGMEELKGKLRPGDLFCSSLGQVLGFLINVVQQHRSSDNEATFSHAGIVETSEGGIIEACWHVERSNLFEKYTSGDLLVARYVEMDSTHFQAGMDKIRKHLGQLYPVHRFLLYLLGVAKYIHWDRIVCSELVSKFLVGAGARHNWYGVMPDDLADEFRNYRIYEVIYDSTCGGE